MKKLCLVMSVFALTACGGGGSDDNPGSAEEQIDQIDQISDCSVVSDTINLNSGDTCNISDTVAATYSVSAGEIDCTDGILFYANSSFSSSKGGITFNGLTFICN